VYDDGGFNGSFKSEDDESNQESNYCVFIAKITECPLNIILSIFPLKNLSFG